MSFFWKEKGFPHVLVPDPDAKLWPEHMGIILISAQTVVAHACSCTLLTRSVLLLPVAAASK